jgi:hypothetical protein
MRWNQNVANMPEQQMRLEEGRLMLVKFIVDNGRQSKTNAFTELPAMENVFIALA